MYRCLKNVFLIFYLAMLGCSNRSAKLNDFYKENAYNLKKTEYLEEIKSTSEDSLYLLTGAYNSFYDGKFLIDSIRNNIWLEVNKERFVKLDRLIKEDILIRSFKRYLDNKEINLDTIKNDAIRAAERRELEWRKKEARWMDELKSLIELNDRNCNVGDTIKLYFQLRNDRSCFNVMYKQYPFSSNFLRADDTLKIVGVLKSKFYDARPSNPALKDNPLDLWFKVKIIYVNKEACQADSETIKRGDVFAFDLEFYGLQIQKYNLDSQ